MPGALQVVSLVFLLAAVGFAVVGLRRTSRTRAPVVAAGALPPELRVRAVQAVREGRLPEAAEGRSRGARDLRAAVVTVATRQSRNEWLPAMLGCLGLNQLALLASGGTSPLVSGLAVTACLVGGAYATGAVLRARRVLGQAAPRDAVRRPGPAG